jgi:hypothetical protein
MVHKFSHYDFVADDRTGSIIDMKNGITSVGCFNLDDDEEKPNNAQSYAFNAAVSYELPIIHTAYAKKTFPGAILV